MTQLLTDQLRLMATEFGDEVGYEDVGAGVELTFADDDIHSMKANLTAGDLAKITTRGLSEGDHICRNEEVWYRPLTKLDHAMPAYALANLKLLTAVSKDELRVQIAGGPQLLEYHFHVVSLRPGHGESASDVVARIAAQRAAHVTAMSAADLATYAVNIGVYKAGLATTQAEYEEAFDALFATMDALDERLARRRFLLGSELCEADVRLFPTLARFDAVYYTLFKCNLRRLIDYQYLWGYARDLYQRPGFGDTTDFDQIKRHYYQTQSWVNPSRIVPKGPYISWLEPHGRDRISG